MSLLAALLLLTEVFPATFADPGFDRGIGDWATTGDRGYQAGISSNYPARPPRRWLHIGWPARSRAPDDSAFRVFTRLDARPYRGRRVRFSAAIRMRAPGGHLAIMAEGASVRSVLLPGETWNRQGVALRIPDRAETIQVSFDVRGGTALDADDVRLEVLR